MDGIAVKYSNAADCHPLLIPVLILAYFQRQGTEYPTLRCRVNTVGDDS